MAPTVYTPPPTEGAANIPDWWNDKDNKKDFDWGTVFFHILFLLLPQFFEHQI
jgi:hypothetical protein